MGDVVAHAAEFVAQLVAHLVEAVAGKMLVEVIGGLGQRGGVVRLVGEDDAIFDLAFHGDDDEQDALVRQAEEFDLAERRVAARRHHQPGKLAEIGQQGGGCRHQALRVGRGQAAFELVDLDLRQRANSQQRVDKKTVAARRGHPPGRGVRAGDIAHLLEVGHDVADAGGRQVQPGVLRQGA